LIHAGAVVPPVGQEPPAAQPRLAASTWQAPGSVGAATTVATPASFVSCIPRMCIAHGAAASATSEAHIGAPPACATAA